MMLNVRIMENQCLEQIFQMQLYHVLQEAPNLSIRPHSQSVIQAKQSALQLENW